MIEQKPVETGAKTVPAALDLGATITAAVEATTGTAFERLKTWLQMPTDSTFKGALDNDCKVRAVNVGDRLSTGAKAYQAGPMSASPTPATAWKSIDTKLAGGVAVTVEGPVNHICGDKSVFRNKDGIGFHVIVLLAAGEDSGGHFYVGLDPDVSATEASRKKWNEVVSAGTKIKEVTDTAESTGIIKAMLLDGSTHAFGPLIRKYYVDVNANFPKIKRA